MVIRVRQRRSLHMHVRNGIKNAALLGHNVHEDLSRHSHVDCEYRWLEVLDNSC